MKKNYLFILIFTCLLSSCFRDTLKNPISLKLENDLVVANIEIKEFTKLSSGKTYFYGLLKYKIIREGAGTYTVLNRADMPPESAFWSDRNKRRAFINRGGVWYKYEENIENNKKYEIEEIDKPSGVGEMFYIKYKDKYIAIYIDSIASVMMNWRLWAGLNIEVEHAVRMTFEDNNIEWEDAELIYTN
jgi:hypothetical protein